MVKKNKKEHCPPGKQTNVFAKKLKKIRKTNKKSEGREKIQNEHCLSGQQTTCSQKH